MAVGSVAGRGWVRVAGWVTLGAGVALLAAAGLIEWLRPRSLGLGFVLGVFGLICFCVVLGAPVRRAQLGAFPRVPYTARLIASGVVLLLVGSAIFTLPPHSVLLATLLLILGAGFFTFGVAMLGGGFFGVLGPVGAGLLGAALMMAPQRLALAEIDHPVSCVATELAGFDLRVRCPGPRTYYFRSKTDTGYEVNDRVRVFTDPHGLLQPMYDGQFDLGEDELGLALSVLAAAGVVTAAAVNRRRTGGHPRRIINPARVGRS